MKRMRIRFRMRVMMRMRMMMRMRRMRMRMRMTKVLLTTTRMRMRMGIVISMRTIVNADDLLKHDENNEQCSTDDNDNSNDNDEVEQFQPYPSCQIWILHHLISRVNYFHLHFLLSIYLTMFNPVHHHVNYQSKPEKPYDSRLPPYVFTSSCPPSVASTLCPRQATSWAKRPPNLPGGVPCPLGGPWKFPLN